MNMKDTYCDVELKKSSTTTPGATLVLSPERWSGIMKHLNKEENDKNLRDQQQKYNDFLREGSKALTREWENSVLAIREIKREEKTKLEREKILEGERRYKEIMENDEKTRKQKLSNAQDLINRLKVGPRQLESATILSEVLKGREIQRSINEEQRRKAKENHLQEGKEVIEQAHQWVEQHSKELAAIKQRTNNYKKELFEYSKEKQKRCQEKSNKTMALQKNERDTADRELKEQIERERAILDRKREAMRKNALEAMKMAEQRRRREIDQNKVQDQIIDIYAKGTQAVHDLRKKKEKESAAISYKNKNDIAKLIYKDNSEELKEEDDRIKRDAKLFEIKIKEKEREKLEHDKKLKAARIQEHIQQTEKEKQQKLDDFEELKWEIANRYKNVEVNLNYDNEKKLNRFRILNANRNILEQQMIERTRKEIASKEIDDFEFAKLENSKDDKQFFAYAEELIADAKKKGRPVLPVQKVVEYYKDHNRLNPQKDVKPHLKSNVPIGDSNETCECKGSNTSFKYELNELKALNPAAMLTPKEEQSKTKLWRNL